MSDFDLALGLFFAKLGEPVSKDTKISHVTSTSEKLDGQPVEISHNRFVAATYQRKTNSILWYGLSNIELAKIEYLLSKD